MKWKNLSQKNSCYFITATLRNFTPVFLDDRAVSIVFDSLDFIRANKGLKIYAYVVMPEHIHLMAGSDTQDISALIGGFKSFTSRKIAEMLATGNPARLNKLKKAAYNGQNHAVWQETFRSELVYGNKFFAEKTNYIHNNPVRRGLVECPADWKHSSFNQVERGEKLAGQGLVVDALEV